MSNTDDPHDDHLDEHFEGEPAPLAGDDVRSRSSARQALARLDRMLDRMRRRKGGGGGPVWTAVKWGFFLFVVAPVVWVLLYRFIEAPETILMAQRAMQGQTISHRTVRLEDISPHLVRAVIAAEDARFCRHDGFDVEAIQKAMAANQRAGNQAKGKVRGGSTISQQTSKNLFLWPQRDWIRKGAETYFTVLTEFFWSKRRIMEAYLNAAEWGDGNFGAEAAAQAAFGKSAKKLTAYEAATLAAVLPSPNRWSSKRPGPYVRKRAASIEARMWIVARQGLDLCVLEPGAAPPPPPTRNGKTVEPEDVLPPLAEPPPSVVEGDPALLPGEDMTAPLEDPSAVPISPEAPTEPEAPADAPGESSTTPAPTAPPRSQDNSSSDGGGPLDISPGN